MKLTSFLCKMLNRFIFLVLLSAPIFLYSEIDSLCLLGYEKFEKKQFDSALVYFNQLAQIYPQKKEALYNRGLCFYMTGKFANAIADFDSCLKIDSTFKAAVLMKSLAVQNTGAVTKEITGFKSGDTTYTGYETLEKRIKRYQLAVQLSRNWYYMIAIMFLVIILLAVISKSYAYKR